MLRVQVITQGNDAKFWQDTFSNVWEGQLEISLCKAYQDKGEVDLVILDFSDSIQINAHEFLADFTPNLTGKHFLIVSDKKDADLAIEAIRLGAIGFLVKPFKRSDFITSLDRLHTTPKAQVPIKHRARIVTLISYKGGTGVSTAVVNLGYAISNVCQKKTLIIDAAGFSNHVTVLLNIIPKCTIADICKQGVKLDEEYLMNAISPVGENLAVIGGLIKTTDINDVNLQGLEHLIEVASEVYDYILVDTSSHVLDEVTMFFVQKANDILLLTTFDLLGIRDNRFFIQTLKEFGVMEGRIKPVINRQDWYIGSLEPELVQKQLNQVIYHSLPNDWQLCVEAANYGRPVLEFAPNSTLSTSYKILAAKVTKSDIGAQVQIEGQEKETELHDDKKGKKKGLLPWFQ